MVASLDRCISLSIILSRMAVLSGSVPTRQRPSECNCSILSRGHVGPSPLTCLYRSVEAAALFAHDSQLERRART